eukprot:259327_1
MSSCGDSGASASEANENVMFTIDGVSIYGRRYVDGCKENLDVSHKEEMCSLLTDFFEEEQSGLEVVSSIDESENDSLDSSMLNRNKYADFFEIVRNLLDDVEENCIAIFMLLRAFKLFRLTPGDSPPWRHPDDPLEPELAAIPTEYALMNAIYEEKWDDFERLLNDDRIDINATNANHDSPLTLAIRVGDMRMARALIKCTRVDMNQPEAGGRTPLMVATQTCSFDLVSDLLACDRVDRTIPNDEGANALHCTAMVGRPDITQILVDTPQLDINAKNNLGQTALHLACCETKCIEDLDIILSHPNVDVNALDNRGLTPLITAISAANPLAVQRLVDCLDVNVNLICGKHDDPELKDVNALMVACAMNVDMLKILLTSKELDLSVGNGVFHPLCVVLMEKNQCVFQLLLDDVRTDVNKQLPKSEGRRTVLHMAALMGEADFVRRLLTHPYINVNLRDSDGATPFHTSCEGGRTKIAKMLLESGKLDINSRKFYRLENDVYNDILEEDYEMEPPADRWKTPLLIAVKNWHVDIIKLLLAHPDIDVNAQDHMRNTALHYTSPRLSKCSSWTYPDEILRLLLQNDKLDVNRKDILGRTAFMVHADCADMEAKRGKLFLANSRVDLSCVDRYKKNVLFWAVGRRNIDLVRLLLTRESLDIFHKNEHGETASEYYGYDDDSCFGKEFSDIHALIREEMDRRVVRMRRLIRRWGLPDDIASMVLKCTW